MHSPKATVQSAPLLAGALTSAESSGQDDSIPPGETQKPGHNYLQPSHQESRLSKGPEAETCVPTSTALSPHKQPSHCLSLPSFREEKKNVFVSLPFNVTEIKA